MTSCNNSYLYAIACYPTLNPQLHMLYPETDRNIRSERVIWRRGVLESLEEGSLKLGGLKMGFATVSHQLRGVLAEAADQVMV